MCIQRDVMKGFLQEHGAEVENMLYTEWNIDDMCRVAREEGWEDGLEQGWERGRMEILVNLVKQKILSAEEGARQAHMPEAELLALVN